MIEAPPFSRFVIDCCLERSDNVPLKSSEYKRPPILSSRLEISCRSRETCNFRVTEKANKTRMCLDMNRYPFSSLLSCRLTRK
jgi:hypothetical protein